MPPLPGPWPAILDEARHYPSPHNSQPILVRVLDAATAEVAYDLDLGLPAESFGIPFGLVCAGVFLESLATVAAGHGWTVAESLHEEGLDFAAAERRQLLGTVTLSPTEVTAEAGDRLAAFRRRRTSRRPYRPVPVPEAALAAVAATADRMDQTFGHTAEPELVARLIRINQQTLFDDLRNDAVHAEILAWIRTSKRRAAATRDGLSAETMLLPGPLLDFAMRHRGMWELPVIGAVLRGAYLRTMRGVRQLGWLTGPFGTPGDHIEAGRCFQRIWLEFTRHDVYLHPFGTVITNPRSHAAFVDSAGIREDDGRTAWMLFRFGHSRRPPEAFRRELAAMLTDLEPAGGPA